MMGYNYDDMIAESRDSYAKAYTDIATAALLRLPAGTGGETAQLPT